MHFTPPSAAIFLGVNPSTIKRWVDKGFLKAEITPGGHRRIHRDEMARFLKEHPRYGPSSYIARKIDTEVTDAVTERYYTLLFERAYTKARDEISRLFLSGTKLEEIIERVIAPALARIGMEWAERRVDITDEHRISFVVRSHLLFLEAMIPEPKPSAPLVLLACPPNEQHEIPLVIIALLLRSYGLRSEVLGINVPQEDIVREVARTRPFAVGLSKLFIKNTIDKEYSRRVGAAARKVGAMLLLGGSGWTPEEVTRFSSSKTKVYRIRNSSDLRSRVTSQAKRAPL